jgi:hypothetical protein
VRTHQLLECLSESFAYHLGPPSVGRSSDHSESLRVLILAAKELYHIVPCESSTCVLARVSFWCIP